MTKSADPSIQRVKSLQRLPIVEASSSHVALCYMKVVRRGVTLQELREFSNTKFANFYVKGLDKLVKLGYAQVVGDGSYAITNDGIALIYEVARQSRLRKDARGMSED